MHWNSEGALGTPDRYELDVSSGVVDFKFDTYASKVARPAVAPAVAQPTGGSASALDVLLDGVEARIKARS